MTNLTSQWQNQRLLVTGGSVFIGKRPLALGQTLNIDLHATSHTGDLPAGVTPHQADLANHADIAALVEAVQPTVIFHTAAAGVGYGTGTLNQMLQINSLGLQSLLEAAAKLPTPPHVVIAGSGFEYAVEDRPTKETDPLQPFTPYGLSKAVSSVIAAYYAAKMPVTVLRLFSIYGTGERAPRLVPYIIEAAVKGESILLTACEQQRDYTFVDDIAEAFFRVGSRPPTDKQLSILNVRLGKMSPCSTWCKPWPTCWPNMATRPT